MLGICSSNNNNNHCLQSLHHVKGDLYTYMYIVSGNPVSLTLSYFCNNSISLPSPYKLPSSRARYLERDIHTTHLHTQALSSPPTAISAHHHNLIGRWSLQIEGPPIATLFRDSRCPWQQPKLIIIDHHIKSNLL